MHLSKENPQEETLGVTTALDHFYLAIGESVEKMTLDPKKISYIKTLFMQKRIQHSPPSCLSPPWSQKYQGIILSELRGITKIPKFNGEDRQGKVFASHFGHRGSMASHVVHK